MLCAPETLYTRRLTQATDVFALAAVLVQIFLGDDGRDDFRRNASTLPSGVLSRKEDVSAWPRKLRAVLSACRSLDPDKRPAAAAVERSLAHVLAGFGDFVRD